MQSTRTFLAASSIIIGLTVASAPGYAAAAGKDCPNVGMLANFTAPDDPQFTGYDSRDFATQQGDQKKTVTETGKVCKQIYRLKPGEAKMSGLEIMSNYEQSLPAAGATITNPGRGGDDDLYATMKKDGVESWYYVYQSNGDTVTVTEVQVAPFQRTITMPSGNDYRLLGHLPVTTSRPPLKVNFDEVAFITMDGTQKKDVKVRGYHYKVVYDPIKKGPILSGLEIQDNYLAALNDLGAEILYNDPGSETVARLDDKGTTVWIDVTGGTNGSITVNAVEEKPFVMSIKPPEAAEIKTSLETTGRMALYINFDFNKATLKPDAQPIIAQVVALMKADPTLNVSIDGNTDNVGTHDYNVKLSQDRAASVVKAVVAGGIAANRLVSHGYGPDKPLGPNDTEAERAKNRRVDLVKQ